jgi:hypothetical protein
MDDWEKIDLKAACIKAAAILLADQLAQMDPRRGGDAAPDTASCARFARDLFGKLTGEPWD